MFAATTFPMSTSRCPARPSMGERIVQYSRFRRAVSTAAWLCWTWASATSSSVLSLVVFLLRDRLRLQKLGIACELNSGQIQLRLVLRKGGLGRVELGLVRPRIDREEQVAGLQVRAVGEMNLRDAAGHLRLDGDHLARHGLADAVEVHGHVLRDRCDDGYRSRRTGESGLGLFITPSQRR